MYYFSRLITNTPISKLIKTTPILLFLSCFIYSQQSTSKKYSVLKSTLTTVGSSSIYNLNNKYTIYQSIG